MNHTRHDLLSIGMFARVTLLSIKALRLYAELGLLPPRYIDPDSGYRYYHAEQVTRARQIRLMREIEMPLATIRQVLGASSPEAAELLVRSYWQARETRITQARVLVQNLLQNLRGEKVSMSYEIGVRRVPPQPVVSIQGKVKVDGLIDYIQTCLEKLNRHLERQNANPAGAAFGLYHGPINHEEDGPIEVCIPVEHSMTAGEGMTVRELLGGQLAYVTMKGDECDFPKILEGYDAVYDWIQQNGFTPLESPREVWLTPPGNSGPDERLEIAWLFAEKSLS
jgi:DNA-binding transcriptional MerR regulator